MAGAISVIVVSMTTPPLGASPAAARQAPSCPDSCSSGMNARRFPLPHQEPRRTRSRAVVPFNIGTPAPGLPLLAPTAEAGTVWLYVTAAIEPESATEWPGVGDR